MLSPLVVGIMAFVGVASLVGGAVLLLHDKPTSKMEDRLDLLTGSNVSAAAKEALLKPTSLLNQPLDQRRSIFDRFVEHFGNVDLLFEQADTSLTLSRLLLISLAMAMFGPAAGVILKVHLALIPVMSLVLGGLPLAWVLFRRRRRLKAFAAQLPEALEMMARTLRAGQSLGFAFNLVANEMAPPLNKEFGRVFEEQNLGVPLEESLYALANRIPNLDLKFFVTAVILQRQTGGDLAEILDKIGDLIRQRFKIWGQVQALTGEGRLSGVVLMALPVVLFIAVFQLNPGYLTILFTDPLGKKMLAVAVFLQVLGAVVIRKIVNIKV